MIISLNYYFVALGFSSNYLEYNTRVSYQVQIYKYISVFITVNIIDVENFYAVKYIFAHFYKNSRLRHLYLTGSGFSRPDATVRRKRSVSQCPAWRNHCSQGKVYLKQFWRQLYSA